MKRARATLSPSCRCGRDGRSQDPRGRVLLRRLLSFMGKQARNRRGTGAEPARQTMMTMINDLTVRLGAALRGVALLMLQLVLAAVGFVFVLAAVAFGLVLGSLLMLWALLRGRRPNLHFGVPPSAAWQRFDAATGRRAGGAMRRAAAPWAGEVVDAEVNEAVPPAPDDRPR